MGPIVERAVERGLVVVEVCVGHSYNLKYPSRVYPGRYRYVLLDLTYLLVRLKYMPTIIWALLSSNLSLLQDILAFCRRVRQGQGCFTANLNIR